MTDYEDARLIGFVTPDSDDPHMVCVDCADLHETTVNDWPKVYDGQAYGEQVPYPECYECSEVMRPERLDRVIRRGDSP